MAVSVGTRENRRDGRRGWEDFTTSVAESLFNHGIFKPIEHAAGDKQDIGARGNETLLGAKDLAETPLSAGAGDGVANRGTGGDYAKPRRGGLGRRCKGIGWLKIRTRMQSLRQSWDIPKDKGAAIKAAAFGSDVLKIQRATQMLVGAETHSTGAQAQENRPVAVAVTVGWAKGE